VLTAEIDSQSYLFDNLSGKTAETLVHQWASVKLTEPYNGAETQERTLNLASASIAATGYTAQGKVATLLAGAKALVEAHDSRGASEKYRQVLALDPANQAAKDGLAAIGGAQAATENQKLNRLGVTKFPNSPLLWTLRDNGSNLNWQAASNYCRNLRLNGNGWRLPTIDELKQIRGSARFGLQLSDVAAFYWSSSLQHTGNLGPDFDEAWMINFAGMDVRTGPVKMGGPELDAPVRAICVRPDTGPAAAIPVDPSAGRRFIAADFAAPPNDPDGQTPVTTNRR
jgi:hypothetical protein